jgi:hypothetical protein
VCLPIMNMEVHNNASQNGHTNITGIPPCTVERTNSDEAIINMLGDRGVHTIVR